MTRQCIRRASSSPNRKCLPTCRRQYSTSTWNEAAIGGKPVRAAVQCATRIVDCDFGVEFSDLGLRNIGRIGNDEIERPLHPIEPARLDRLQSLSNAEA